MLVEEHEDTADSTSCYALRPVSIDFKTLNENKKEVLCCVCVVTIIFNVEGFCVVLSYVVKQCVVL